MKNIEIDHNYRKHHITKNKDRKYLTGIYTPVFFGTALHNFGISEFLDCLTKYAPAPQPRVTKERKIEPNENKLSGFIFKIQANMDPAHRDRIAFLRICSGRYFKGMKMHHVRLERDIQISNALTFLAHSFANFRSLFIIPAENPGL